MNLPLGRPFRLVPRGGPGLACDSGGVSLGEVPLVSMERAFGLAKVRPVGILANILRLAYGPQPPDVVQRCHRGLERVAARLEGGDLTLACLEAVMIGFPDPAPQALVKLVAFAHLEKAGTAWQNEPRLPAGQTGGGQWTTGGGDAPAASGAASASAASPPPAQPSLPRGSIDDGVYHPSQDRPALVLTGAGEDAAEEGFRTGMGGNEPPRDDLMELTDLFPGLRNEPDLTIPLAPIDSFLGISGLANEANLQAASMTYSYLYNQIRAIDPNYRDRELQTLAQTTWQGRIAVINNLRMELAVTYYRVRHDIEPLQVETIRFLQGAIDQAYEREVQNYEGSAPPGSRARASEIGTGIDAGVRDALKGLFTRYGVPFGAGQNITINNRDHRSEDQTYRVPDARLGNVSVDWSLTPKSLANGQVRGFFRADSAPDAVVIMRPSQLGQDASYLITRPPSPIRRVEYAAEI